MKKSVWLFLGWICMTFTLHAQHKGGTDESILNGGSFTYKVGFLGNPSSWNRFEMTVPVPWTATTVNQLKRLGFNTVQINLAWGTRPDDEALNLEDIVHLTPEQEQQYPQVVPLMSKPGKEAFEKRRTELRNRIALCKKAGLRTIFHFGAPYNHHGTYKSCPPNLLTDPKVTQRYILLLQTFAREFPGVDDILIYNYDQGAWLGSEFDCPGSLGIPLVERVVPFLNSLSACWSKISPHGRLWWEPWELSDGQSLSCLEKVNPEGIGLALHANIAEVMASYTVDRWFRNMAAIARQRNIPVIGEYFLSSPSEEVETFFHFPYPLTTLHGLKAIAGVPGVVGIKEYYGLNPTVEDPNLRMTSIFFNNPGISEAAALEALSRPYGSAAKDVSDMWRLTSEGMEIFPWNLSWKLRRMGAKLPMHDLDAAVLNGFVAHTPSWASSRGEVYMKIDNSPSDPWLIEDIQLRSQLAAERWKAAYALGNKCKQLVPATLAADFEKQLDDISGMYRRALSFASHLRETNLALVLRNADSLNLKLPKNVDELRQVMKADLENYNEERAVLAKEEKNIPEWEAMKEAIRQLDHDPALFLQQYFR